MQILTTFVLIISALFAFYRLFKTTDRLANSIVFLQITGVASILLGIPEIQIIGFYALLASLLLALVYSLRNANKPKRLVLLLAILPLLFLYLFKAFHLQGIQVLAYSAVISLGSVVYAFMKHKDFRNEIGFLAIIGAESFIRSIEPFL